MYSSSVLLITILAINTPVNANWSIGTSQMPNSNYMMAVAATNESIFLLGGLQSNDVLEFNQTSFVDKQLSTPNTYGTSQYYTQMNDKLFMIDSQEQYFNVYNTKNNSFVSNWNSATIPFVDHEACLTSTSQFLFIFGGANNSVLNTVHIFDIVKTVHILDTTMNIARKSFSCNYVELTDELYVIGGLNSLGYVNSVETITITDIVNGASWNNSQVSNLITNNAAGIRSVVYGKYIVVVGGENAVDVNIINVLDGTVTVSGHNMIYSVEYPSVVIFNDILYVFGGWNGSRGLKIWQSIELSSMGIGTTEPTTSIPTTTIPTPVLQLTLQAEPTLAPTTAVPTTVQPTTQVPTTVQPTTHVPTTVQPTTQVPTTVEQTLTPNAVSTKYNKLNDTAEDDGTIVIIIVVFGSVVILCVLLLGIMVVYKLRKQQKENIEEIILSEINSVSTVKDTDENKVNGKIEVESIAGNNKNGTNMLSSLNSVSSVNDEHKTSKSAKNECEQYETIKQWLTETVELPQYHENFIVNGYTSVSFIKAIKSKTDLSEIGITLKGHQMVIIDEINRLNGNNMNHKTENSQSFQQEGGATSEGGVRVTGGKYENEVMNNPNITENDIVIDNDNNTMK